MTNIILRRKIIQARWWALFFAALGVIPLELIIPTIAAVWKHNVFIFLVLSLYFMIYIIYLSNSLRVLWKCDRKVLKNLHITNLKIGRIGTMFVSAIEWAKMWSYQQRWHFTWKCLYFMVLFILGCLPFFVKFGIGLCVLKKNNFSYICLILGTTMRAYLLVFVGADIFRWVMDYVAK